MGRGRLSTQATPGCSPMILHFFSDNLLFQKIWKTFWQLWRQRNFWNIVILWILEGLWVFLQEESLSNYAFYPWVGILYFPEIEDTINYITFWKFGNNKKKLEIEDPINCSTFWNIEHMKRRGFSIFCNFLHINCGNPKI